MALPTNIGSLEPRLRTDVAVDRSNVMGVMTVVTGRISPRLVFSIGPRVNRLHIIVDLLHDLAQSC